MPRLAWALTLALARCLEPLTIEVEVNDVPQQLVASPDEDPRAAAGRFCVHHNLTLSVEGMDCDEVLAEELISKGARFPLPLEPLLRLSSARDAAGDARRECALRGWRDCGALEADAAALEASGALGPGELLAPLDVARRALAAPRATVPVEFDWSDGALTLVAWPTPLSPGGSDVAVVPDDGCAGDPFGRAAAAFCVAHRCPRRASTAARLADGLRAEFDVAPCRRGVPRLVASMSTLPGRIAMVAGRQLRFLQRQTRPADEIYVVVPEVSTRDRVAYAIPEDLEAASARGELRLLRTAVDWGPATKLLPVLLVETDPETVVVTLDDDVDYPRTLLAELLAGALRRPDAALGLRGYWLPPAPEVLGRARADCRGDLDFSHVNESLDHGYYSHLNLLYADSVDHDVDVDVHILGGLAGVAYRSGFFDARRLADYGNWHPGAYFVDDDWISLALDEAGVPRLVLGLRGNEAGAAYAFRDEPLIAPHHAVSAPNGAGKGRELPNFKGS